ncbi:MAG: hypothetical protein WBO66_01065 [Candidatus Moraniibacteriota bacterium]
MNKLSFVQKKQLAHSLLQCPSVNDETDLASALRSLDDVNLEIRGLIRKGSKLLTYVFNIVDICTNFNAIDTLIDAIAFFEGDSIPMNTVQKTWQGIKIVNSGETLVQELTHIVNELNLSQELLAAYTALAWPHRYIETKRSIDMSGQIRDIWNCNNQPNGSVPVLVFAYALYKHIHDDDADMAHLLSIWIEDVATLKGISSEDSRKHFSESNTMLEGDWSSLQVELEPHDDNINDGYGFRYRPRLYLWSKSRKEWMNAGENYYTLEEIGATVRRTIADIGREGVDTAHLAIEFFLPTALLSIPVEQQGKDLDNISLGDEYAVVVRPLDRARDPGHRGHSRWKRSWRRFRIATQGYGIESGMLQILNENHIAEEPRFLLEAFRHLLCLGIDQDDTRVLRLAVNAGLPIVLWSRKRNAEVADIFRHLICTQRLPDLPQHVHNARLRSKEEMPGRHMSLLWDDYDRLPQDWNVTKSYAFHSPSKELNSD